MPGVLGKFGAGVAELDHLEWKHGNNSWHPKPTPMAIDSQDTPG